MTDLEKEKKLYLFLRKEVAQLSKQQGIPEVHYRAQYAKTDRSSCNGCSEKIEKDELRLSRREVSLRFKGIQDFWFHTSCFFDKLEPVKDVLEINERSIEFIETLHWDDRELLRSKLASFRCSPVDKYYSDFKVEYSKTSRGQCSVCSKAFAKSELRAAKATESEWFHIDCGMPSNSILEGHASDIRGFATLIEHDQVALKTMFYPIDDDVDEKKAETSDSTTEVEPRFLSFKEASAKYDEWKEASWKFVRDYHAKVVGAYSDSDAALEEGQSASKRPRLQTNQNQEGDESISDIDSSKEELGEEADLLWKNQEGEAEEFNSEIDTLKEKLRKQADLMWELRRVFDTHLTQKEMLKLLAKNKQILPADYSYSIKPRKVLDVLVDSALFGTPIACQKCPNNAQMVFSLSKRTYVSLGYCTHIKRNGNKNPARVPFIIPDEMREGNEFLKNVKVNLLPCRLYCHSNDQIDDS